ncbi:hypothetical protein GCM10023403_27790 [Pseudonocardia benzenivorans]
MTQSDEASPSIEMSVNNQGRVTIPAQVRRAAGIEPGDSVLIHVEDGRVVIETRAQLAARVRREVAAAWEGTGSVVDELAAERRAEARAEAGGITAADERPDADDATGGADDDPDPER